jgi:DNA-binding MarR family transcriptional regulator
MKRQNLALKHLKTHGMTFGRALASAIGVATNNLSTTMKPLIASGEVVKGRDQETRASTYSLTQKGLARATCKEVPEHSIETRIDPADPFGLLAKLRASHASSRHPSIPTQNEGAFK